MKRISTEMDFNLIGAIYVLYTWNLFLDAISFVPTSFDSGSNLTLPHTLFRPQYCFVLLRSQNHSKSWMIFKNSVGRSTCLTNLIQPSLPGIHSLLIFFFMVLIFSTHPVEFLARQKEYTNL